MNGAPESTPGISSRTGPGFRSLAPGLSQLQNETSNLGLLHGVGLTEPGGEALASRALRAELEPVKR